MKKVVLTRIDDRLIHGQVVTRWIKETNATRVVIIDDQVASDEFMIQILTMAAPPGIKVDVYSVEVAVEDLLGEENQKERIVILVKVPQVLEDLIENEVDIKEIVVGGMGASRGRKKFYKNISASIDEIQSFKNLIEKGVKVVVQIMPDDRPISVDKIYKK